MHIPFLKVQTICFVCRKVIKGEIRYIGKGMYRCEKCKPGSARWKRSSVGKKSDAREFFLLQADDSGNKKTAKKADDMQELLKF